MPNVARFRPETPEILDDQIATLRRLFPDVFSEGKIDFEKLRLILGDQVEERPERYSFTWAGKRDALRLLQTPTRATLRPAPEESVDFDTTQNVFIEGDNLEVLKLLYKAYFGRVKLIYIDPPYNTGNDFVYPDNYADPLAIYLQLTGQQDTEGNLLTSNPESSGRYHSAWLSMMYPRLFIARQLLREDGFIVISIDDTEEYNLRQIMNELFGEENFVAVLVWDRNRKNDAKLFSVGHEYMLVYSKNRQYLKDNKIVLRAQKEGIDEVREEYEKLRTIFEDDDNAIAERLKEWFSNLPKGDPILPLARFNKVDHRGPFRSDGNINWPGGGGPLYEVIHPITKKPCKKPTSGWRFPTKARMEEEIAKGNIVFGKDETKVPSVKWYLFEKDEQVMRSVNFSYAQVAAQEFDKFFDGKKVFENPKHFGDLSRIVEYLTDEDDLILDFFAGSCSTAHAILNTNRLRGSSRKFICVQLPEPVNQKAHTGQNDLELGLATIADIGKERIRRVIARMKAERAGQLPLEQAEDLGFRVFQLALSSFRSWAGTPEAEPEPYAQQMAHFNDPLEAGWDARAVICEVALKEGYGLNLQIAVVGEVVQDDGKPADIFCVTDPDRGQSFYITLAVRVHPEYIQGIFLQADTLFVCRDIALDDEGAANLALQCRLMTI